ncbi:STAS domain-containing protein [Lederbergia lenta]|uniref:Anti-sigma-factor antagonist n=1 Tax=Lederbergia lenta TaxID=1467 RepID=A0A2X4VTB7_LEDLE|nr:STAS domain-containing protein [Lederbergia lenta]MCM3110980.1 STAS domain-containing protein [Lederbergia lenta]MEC2325624.1 STAS domain-containing protein [Lederbergia lenta]SQI54133.1 anti-sigma-factor antagonist [Lederbergia lenta]
MKPNEHVKTVDGVRFSWDMDRGLLQYEGADVVLFWIDTAFKTFIDTIEEITGTESARIVMEATGYRTGKIVSDFFARNTKNEEELLTLLPNIYKSAGWGSFTIIEFSNERKEAVIQLREDWELKINQLQNKKEPGSFLAGHWAGILSGLFQEKVWYRIVKHPFSGDDVTEIEFFPSNISPAENIRELLSSKEQYEITTLEAMVEDRTRDLKKLVSDLSSPIIPVLENIVVVPMMGRFDESRSTELIEKTLQGAIDYQANIIIFDVTGMNELDNYAISLLGNIIQAVSLVGATPIIVGISPDLSMQLISSGVYLRELKCFATLKHAVHYGLALEGMQITFK